MRMFVIDGPIIDAAQWVVNKTQRDGIKWATDALILGVVLSLLKSVFSPEIKYFWLAMTAICGTGLFFYSRIRAEEIRDGYLLSIMRCLSVGNILVSVMILIVGSANESVAFRLAHLCAEVAFLAYAGFMDTDKPAPPRRREEHNTSVNFSG